MQYELNKHVKEMHSNKVFVCAFCNETCRWRHTMRRHIKVSCAPPASCVLRWVVQCHDRLSYCVTSATEEASQIRQLGRQS